MKKVDIENLIFARCRRFYFKQCPPVHSTVKIKIIIKILFKTSSILKPLLKQTTITPYNKFKTNNNE